MSIYIPGMEMPTSCNSCRFCGRGGLWNERVVCMFTGANAYMNEVQYLDGCPLISVPEHGELVDRREMDVLSWHEGEYGTDFDSGVMFVLDKLDELSTIIPADPVEEETE